MTIYQAVQNRKRYGQVAIPPYLLTRATLGQFVDWAYSNPSLIPHELYALLEQVEAARSRLDATPFSTLLEELHS